MNAFTVTGLILVIGELFAGYKYTVAIVPNVIILYYRCS